MNIRDKIIIVTGGAHGIGRAMCERFASEGARHVVVADLDESTSRNVASQINGTALLCDVSCEADIQEIVSHTLDVHGHIDLFCSNAGITTKGGAEVPDADWQRLWNVNVMAHVYAARAVLPSMLERGEGYLLHTSSAAGLMTEIGSAPYSVTKHAVIAFAEWLSIHYQKKGLRISCLCPAGVATDFLDLDDPIHQFLHVSSVPPEDVADAVVRGLADERFLIIPDQHLPVQEFFAYKGEDYDRWLKNFARINEKLERIKSRNSSS
ncbi:MAG: SDR family oxidoreductase [Planctomycetaceae bacterium]|nr:SDR family oxidoreductase [Planctomycetaceae bacterium]